MNKTIMHIVPAFRVGGAEVMVENLLIELKRQNYNVIAVSFFNFHSTITEHLEKNGIPIEYLNKKHGFDIFSLLKLRNLILRVKPEVIHTHLYILEYVYAASIGIKTKIIHTVHNIADKEVQGIRKKIRKLLFRFKKITPIAISPIVQKSLSDLYGLSETHFPMVYNGINLKKCIKKNDYTLKNPIVFLSVGRLEEQKNHLNLIRAFSDFSKECGDRIILNIIGEGSKRSELEETIKDLNCKESVFLLGEKEDIYKYLSETDIFILPSKWEGMPISLIEAMNSGVPIIASDVGGVPDMIENNLSGILCSSDLLSIIYTFRIMLSLTTQQRSQMAMEAINRSYQFSAENMCKNYLKIYFD